MNAIDKNQIEKIVVLALTQKWTNLGLSLASLFTALFTYVLLNSSLLDWWMSLSNSLFISLLLLILLIIPVSIILIICIVAYETFNSIAFRLFLLIVFSFLLSVFNVFIVSSASDMAAVIPCRSIGIFLVYSFIFLSALFFIDFFLMPAIHISQNIWLHIGFKILLSLPFVIIIWQVTNNAWIFLALLIIIIYYFFYTVKTSLVWATICKSYLGDFIFQGPKTKEFPKGQLINIIHNDNYKKLGLYFSLYNSLTPLFNFLNAHVEQLDLVTENLDDDPQEGYPNKLDILYEDDVCNSNSLTTGERNLLQKTFDKRNTIYRCIIAILFYISFCFILYFIGNLLGS